MMGEYEQPSFVGVELPKLVDGYRWYVGEDNKLYILHRNRYTKRRIFRKPRNIERWTARFEGQTLLYGRDPTVCAEFLLMEYYEEYNQYVLERGLTHLNTIPDIRPPDIADEDLRRCVLPELPELLCWKLHREPQYDYSQVKMNIVMAKKTRDAMKMVSRYLSYHDNDLQTPELSLMSSPVEIAELTRTFVSDNQVEIDEKAELAKDAVEAASKTMLDFRQYREDINGTQDPDLR